MKKSLVNKKVIKALTIGLSLAMASQPLTAMAAEDNGNSEGNSNTTDYKDIQNGVADDAQETAETSWKEIKTAEADSKTAVEVADALKTAGESTQKIDKAADKLEETTQFEAQNTNAPEVHVQNAEGELIMAENFDAIATKNVEDIKTEVANAEAAVQAATEAETTYNETMDTAEEALKNAGSIPAADEAIADARNAYTEVSKAFEDAAADYEAAEGAYQTALTNLKANQAAYDAALESASSEAGKAKTALEAAEKNAAELKAKAEEAKKNYVKDGYAKIAELEAIINEKNKNVSEAQARKNGTFLNEMRDLFKTIMKVEYLTEDRYPGIDTKSIKITEPDKSLNKTPRDQEYNTYVITFMQSGVQQKMELNYVQADNNSLGGLVIFEKKEYFDCKDLGLHYHLSDEEKTALANGEAVTAQSVNGEDRILVAVGDGYVAVKPEDSTNTYNRTKAANEEYSNVETSWSVAEDGTLVKTETGTVTTTNTYAKTLTGGSGFESEAAALEAAEAETAGMLTGGTAENKNFNAEKEESTEYTATIKSYNGFTKTVGTAKYSNIGDFFGLSASKEEVTKEIDSELAKNGYVRISDVEGWDGKLFECSYTYAKLNSVVTATGATMEAALNAAKAKLANGAVILDTQYDSTGVETWKYSGTFNEVKTSVANNLLLSTTAWDSEDVKETKRVLNNDNFKEGNILFSEYEGNYKANAERYKNDAAHKWYAEATDKAAVEYQLTDEQQAETVSFRAKINDANKKRTDLINLINAADKADKDLKAAAETVKTLEEQIDELEKTFASDKVLKDLQDRLDAAKLVYNQLAEKKTEAENRLADAEAAYKTTVARLTPSASTTGDGGTGDTTTAGGATAGAATDIITPGAPAAGGLGTVVVPGGVAGGAAVADAGDGAATQLTDIGNGNTALAAGLDEETAPEVTAINEGDTPLTYAPIDEESISWWWWIIIALLGATGYAMYKKHQEKKAEKITK